MGLKTAALLAQRAGMVVTNGVILDWSPKAPCMTMVAYGVHMQTHSEMFIRATLAMRISALWVLASALLRSEVTFILAACSRSVASCSKMVRTM